MTNYRDFDKEARDNREKEKSARKRRLWVYRIIALLGLVAIILILIFKPVHCDCDCEDKVSSIISTQLTGQQVDEPTSPSQMATEAN